MVKVLENRIVDLDIMPGTKEQQAAARAKQSQREFEKRLENPHTLSPSESVTDAGRILALTVGDTVKSVVNTSGNTVGVLGMGLYGTVAGVGKGLGSVAIAGGNALGGLLPGESVDEDGLKEGRGIEKSGERGVVMGKATGET